MWTGDALGLCTSGFPPEPLFDVIDTSNVSDHIGLLNVLICCAPRLKVYVQRSHSSQSVETITFCFCFGKFCYTASWPVFC